MYRSVNTRIATTMAILLLASLPAVVKAAASYTPIAPPTLSITINGTDVALAWTAPTKNTDNSTPAKVTGYNVYRSTTTPIKQQAGTGAPAPYVSYSIKAGTLSYTDTGSASLSYYYAISAWYCDSAGCSESVTGPTVRATATPATPVVTVVGTANFHWVPPTARSDGSLLTNLAGYKLYRGATCDSQPAVTTINNPSLVSYQDTNVPIGAYCYSLTSYDSNNVESLKSQNIFITFTTPPSLPGTPGQPTASCVVAAPQGFAVSCTITP